MPKIIKSQSSGYLCRSDYLS